MYEDKRFVLSRTLIMVYFDVRKKINNNSNYQANVKTVSLAKAFTCNPGFTSSKDLYLFRRLSCYYFCSFLSTFQRHFCLLNRKYLLRVSEGAGIVPKRYLNSFALPGVWPEEPNTDSECSLHKTRAFKLQENSKIYDTGQKTNKVVKPYALFQNQDHVKMAYRWMLVASLVVGIIQHWVFAFVDPSDLATRSRSSNMSMSKYDMRTFTIMLRLNAIA